ncbi:MAG: shikimate kinase [Rikenellaceae bacterium]|nr:shikimate kinase [Rikenellaceae bacterium]MCL2692291.1 shikimate kinase [Rikenellaceae bacterium]
MVFFIVGFMGAGKSSVGRKVARRAGMRFVDIDAQVEQMHGASVAEIFAREGEATFRKSERAALEQLAESDENIVVSCGGGTPCSGNNMALMNAVGKTIYLKLSPRRLAARLRPGQTKRPILRGLDAEQTLALIMRILPEREPFYDQASMVVDCDTLGDDSICACIAEYIRHHSGSAESR